MHVPLRRKFATPDGTPAPAPTWKRVHRQDLPDEVTILVLPYVGTTWRARRREYWISRIIGMIALAIPAAALAGLDFLILWGEHRRGGYSPAFWATAAVILAIATWSAAAALALDKFPFERMSNSPDRGRSARAVGSTAQGLLALVFLLGTPGMWLAALADQLQPRPTAEKLAQEDLMRQLADHAAGRNPAEMQRRREAATRALAHTTPEPTTTYDPTKPLLWPPLGDLPDGVTIKSVPLLGTTWYERGPAYWIRRTLILLLWLFALAALTAVVGGLAAGAGNGRRNGAFWAVISAEVVLALTTLAYCFVAQHRARDVERESASNPGNPASRISALLRAARIQRLIVLVIILLAVVFCIGAIAKIRILMALSVAPLALLWVIGYGAAIFLFLQMCRPQLPQESAARQELEAALRAALDR